MDSTVPDAVEFYVTKGWNRKDEPWNPGKASPGSGLVFGVHGDSICGMKYIRPFAGLQSYASSSANPIRWRQLSHSYSG